HAHFGRRPLPDGRDDVRPRVHDVRAVQFVARARLVRPRRRRRVARLRRSPVRDRLRGRGEPDWGGPGRRSAGRRSPRRSQVLLLAPWASSTEAMVTVTARAVGRSMNSLGPWAFDCGPRTPVITNWASGYRAANIPTKGIEPPSPYARAGAPKLRSDAASSAPHSHAAKPGAFQ